MGWSNGGPGAAEPDPQAVSRRPQADYPDCVSASDPRLALSGGFPDVNGPALAAALRRRVPLPVTRFAPAPTGFLHLGHIVNAIYVWGLARALGGRVILRIEDHDRQRSSRKHERALIEDLEWLGFEPDVYPLSDYRASRCHGRQSERGEMYRAALDPPIRAGVVYGCRCSRADVERVSPTSVTGGERPYPGTCREQGIPLADDVGWRLRLEPGVETFDDAMEGVQAQDPAAQCGDLLLRDRHGNWTYQCVAAIDDFIQGMSVVIRGLDLLPSTGRQIRLARLAGRPTPATFAHHGLVMKSATQKLSKSDGDSGVRDLRAAGWSAAQVIGHAAALAGLQPNPEPLEAVDVEKLFR